MCRSWTYEYLNHDYTYKTDDTICLFIMTTFAIGASIRLYDDVFNQEPILLKKTMFA